MLTSVLFQRFIAQKLKITWLCKYLIGKHHDSIISFSSDGPTNTLKKIFKVKTGSSKLINIKIVATILLSQNRDFWNILLSTAKKSTLDESEFSSFSIKRQ